MQPFNRPAAELEKIHVETAKLLAETQKFHAEACKMNCETFWYPVAIATCMVGTVATITVLVIKLF